MIFGQGCSIRFPHDNTENECPAQAAKSKDDFLGNEMKRGCYISGTLVDMAVYSI